MGKPDTGLCLGVILVFNVIGAAVVQADSVSKFAGTCQVDDSLPGGADWTAIGNLQGASDDISATVSLTRPGTVYSDYLKCTNFNFFIPAGSTIDDFTVYLRGYASTANVAVVSDFSSLKPGSSSSSSGLWGTTLNLSGFSSLFGLFWEPSEINQPGFGFRFRYYYFLAPDGTITGGADSMEVIVHFTPPPSPIVFENGFEPAE